MTKPSKPATDTEYEVVSGIDFPRGQRREPGDKVLESELPPISVPWLVEVGAITPKSRKE